MPVKPKDYSGFRHNQLTGIRDLGSNGRCRVWLWRCDCGNEVQIASSDLKRKISCGCRNSVNRYNTPAESAANRVYDTYRSRSKKRNIPWNLTRQQFLQIIQQNCFYCGSPPTNAHSYQYSDFTLLYNGVDRIDSSSGYTIGNIVPCCRDCNRAKSDMPLDYFYQWIKRVYHHLQEKGKL